jgi:hypothetical protein
MRRLLGSDKVLTPPEVRISKHTHISVAPWLLGHPLYELVSILLLYIIIPIILPLREATPSNLDNDMNISFRNK